MELLQLKYFREVAHLQSMTKAAEALHIAQPSLSKTIARLEHEIGAPLFDRIGRNIQLNEAGRLFLERTERCLSELESGIEEVHDLTMQSEKRVSIGTTTARMLPDLVKSYLVSNRDVKIRLAQVLLHSALRQRLLEGDMDICISSLPLQGKDICCRELLQEKIYLIVPHTHKLASRKEVTLKELEKENFILYTTESGLGETISQYCEEANFKPDYSCECTTSEVTCGLVEAGLGVSFLPEYLSAMEYTKGVTWIPVKEPEMHRTIWVSWNQQRYLTRAVRSFRDFLFQYFKEPLIK